MEKIYRSLLIPGMLLASACLAQAHAFLDHAEPKVGSQFQVAPPEVKVWFTQKLVPAFSELHVFDADGKEVDKGDKKVAPSDAALMKVSLPLLKPGKYKVVWKAVSIDTHVTHGDFVFEVKP